MNCFHFYVCLCVRRKLLATWRKERKSQHNLDYIYSFIYYCEKKTTFCLVIRIRTRLWSLCEAILSIFFVWLCFWKCLRSRSIHLANITILPNYFTITEILLSVPISLSFLAKVSCQWGKLNLYLVWVYEE